MFENTSHTSDTHMGVYSRFLLAVSFSFSWISMSITKWTEREWEFWWNEMNTVYQWEWCVFVLVMFFSCENVEFLLFYLIILMKFFLFFLLQLLLPSIHSFIQWWPESNRIRITEFGKKNFKAIKKILLIDDDDYSRKLNEAKLFLFLTNLRMDEMELENLTLNNNKKRVIKTCFFKWNFQFHTFLVDSGNKTRFSSDNDDRNIFSCFLFFRKKFLLFFALIWFGLIDYSVFLCVCVWVVEF